MYNRFDTAFEDFLSNIALTKSQAKRIDSALIGLSYLYVEAFEGDVDIYTQGSFATGTIVKPLTEIQSPNGKAGEYDVDVVLERKSWDDATSSLGTARGILANSDRYSALLKPPIKESCERIEYAPEQTGAGFHVDIVPIKFMQETRHVALRSKNRWQISDPKIIIDWYLQNANLHPFLTSVVATMKRMRDVAGYQKLIPSIIILALVGNHYEDKGSYVDDLLNVLDKTCNLLQQTSPQLVIPKVNENLINKWGVDDLSRVKSFFEAARSELKQAFADNDLDAVRRYLSDDFPSELHLPNLQSLRSKGWRIPLDGSLERSNITPVPEPSNLNRRTRRILMFTRRGHKVVFNADPHELSNDQILVWQVLNAPGSDEIRGSFFPAKNASDKVWANDFQNHETVQYKGIHWIRYFIVNKTTGIVDVASIKYKVKLKFLQPVSSNEPSSG